MSNLQKVVIVSITKNVCKLGVDTVPLAVNEIQPIVNNFTHFLINIQRLLVNTATLLKLGLYLLIDIFQSKSTIVFFLEYSLFGGYRPYLTACVAVNPFSILADSGIYRVIPRMAAPRPPANHAL